MKATDLAQEDCGKADPFLDLAKDVLLTDQAVRGGRHGQLLFHCLSVLTLASATAHFFF